MLYTYICTCWSTSRKIVFPPATNYPLVLRIKATKSKEHGIVSTVFSEGPSSDFLLPLTNLDSLREGVYEGSPLDTSLDGPAWVTFDDLLEDQIGASSMCSSCGAADIIVVLHTGRRLCQSCLVAWSEYSYDMVYDIDGDVAWLELPVDIIKRDVVLDDHKAATSRSYHYQKRKVMAPQWHHGTIARRAPKKNRNNCRGKCPKVDLNCEGILRA